MLRCARLVQHAADRPKLAAVSRDWSCDRVKLDASADDVAELFQKHLQEGKLGESKLVNTNKDALHLYRKIQRYTLLFDWPDEHGELWRDKLRRSARHEFEMSRMEMSPANVAKMLLTGSQAVEDIMQRFVKKRAELEEQGKLPRRLTNPYQRYHDT